MAPKCALAGTASPYRCTRRCTQFSALRACRPPSASSSKVRAQAHPRSCKHYPPSHARTHQHHHHHQPHGQGCLKARRLSLHVGGNRARSAFNGPSFELDSTSPPHTRKRSGPSSSSKRKPGRREEERTTLGDHGEEVDGRGSWDGSESGSGSSGGLVGKQNTRQSSSHRACSPAAGGSAGIEGEKAWSARRRDPRINGADIYVARVTKVGMGSARPCWRCVEWCRWAGVKRIFHWNGEDSKFEVVKVNTAEREQYETHADIRLFAGMVSLRSIGFPDLWPSDASRGFISGLVAAAQT